MSTDDYATRIRNAIGDSSVKLNKALAYVRGMALAYESRDHVELARRIGAQFTTPSLVNAAFDGAILVCARGHTTLPIAELAEFIRD